MSENERTVWGIHAGRESQGDNLFINKGFVSLGWYEIGDLKSFKGERELIKEELKNIAPNAKPGAYPNWAGQLYRFAYEINR